MYAILSNSNNNKNLIKHKKFPKLERHIILNETKFRQWWITVPMHRNGVLCDTKLLADPGASIPGVKTSRAIEDHRGSIERVHKGVICDTPNGQMRLNHFITLILQNKYGTIWSVRFWLIPTLPVDYLADINLLEAWGYEFKDGEPPAFRKPIIEHKGNHHIDLQLDKENLITVNEAELYAKQNSSNNQVNLLEMLNVCKQSNDPEIANDTHLINSITINNDTIKLTNNDTKINEDQQQYINYMKCINNEEMVEQAYTSSLNIAAISTADSNDYKIILPMDNYAYDPVSQQILMLEATKAEIDEANARASTLIGQREFEFNDVSYLKKYETKLPGLHEGTMALMNKYKHCFAWKRSQHQSMNIKPISLGIKEKHKEDVVNRRQYPLTREQRLAMTVITQNKIESGLFIKSTRTDYNTPYTMIKKKKDKNGISRLREVYDFRELNSLCEAKPAHMKTINDVNQIMAKPGLKTLCDAHNFFESIPLPEDEWKFTTITTPIGKYMMTHQTYGHKNAAPAGQMIINRVAAFVTDALGWVDDLITAHNPNGNTQDHLDHLERIFKIAETLKILLNPEKFWPYVDEFETIGFYYNNYYHSPTVSYKKKCLLVTLPRLVSEMSSYLSLIQWIARYVWQLAWLTYFLQSIVNQANKSKRKEIEWNETAVKAFKEIQYRIENSIIIYHVQREGIFVVQGDACDHAIGGALLQLQQTEKNTKMYRIVDTYSKQIPPQLMPNGSGIKEGWGICQLCKHWTYYLLPNMFIINSDHLDLTPILYSKDDDVKNPMFLRMRLFLSQFWFIWKWIPGLLFPLIDALSRGRIIIKEFQSYTHNEHKQIKLTSPDDVKAKLTQNNQANLLFQNLRHIEEGHFNTAMKGINCISNELIRIDERQHIRKLKRNNMKLLLNQLNIQNQKLEFNQYQPSTDLVLNLNQNNEYLHHILNITNNIKHDLAKLHKQGYLQSSAKTTKPIQNQDKQQLFQQIQNQTKQNQSIPVCPMMTRSKTKALVAQQHKNIQEQKGYTDQDDQIEKEL